MHEYKWKRLLNKCIYTVTGYFSLFQYLKKFTLFLKKDEHGFLSNTKHYLTTKSLLSPFFQPLWKGFLFYSNFHFLSNHKRFLFFASQNQYFIMFKDSNVFEFTNFPFKTKYVVLSLLSFISVWQILSYCRLFC